MLEIVFLIAGLYFLIIGRIKLGSLLARGGRVRIAGLSLLAAFGVARFIAGMAPAGLSVADAQNASATALLIGFVGAFLLIIRAALSTAPAAVPPDMMTIADAADYFLVTQQVLEQLISRGKIQASRLGSKRYVSKTALATYLNTPAEPANNSLPDLPTSDENRS